MPLIVVAPGLPPQRSGDLASHRDVAPTLLGAFARAEGAERFGRSLLRLRAAPRARLRRFAIVRSFAAASGAIGTSPIAALVHGRYKLVERLDDGTAALFDVVADPTERVDLAAHDRAALEDELDTYRTLDRWPH